jgi:methionyl-tRNA synthetase
VVAADAIARFKRLDGFDVFFMTGHGRARAEDPADGDPRRHHARAFVDDLSPRFRAMAERMNCSFDRFIRTTDPDHLPSTQELWRRMERNGDIYLSRYAGWYSVRDEAYSTKAR